MKKNIPRQVQEILQENIGLKMHRNGLYNKTSASLDIDETMILNDNAISWSDQYTENIKRIADIYLNLGNKKMYDLYLKLYEGRKVFNEAHYSNRFNSIEDQIKKYEEAESVGYPCSSNISVMYDSIGDSEKELFYLKRATKNQRNKKKLDPIGVDEFEIWAYKNLAVYHTERKKTWRAAICFFLAYCYGDKTDWPLKLIVPLLLRFKKNELLNMEFTIQKIQESDFENLVALFQEFALFEKLPEKMTNSLDQMKKEKDYIQGFTAEDESGKIVAYVTCFFGYYTWTGKSLYMDDLYVRESYRGKGLGTRLINEVISFARKEDCCKLRWQVSNWNSLAIKFYENLGAEINPIEMNCDLVLN